MNQTIQLKKFFRNQIMKITNNYKKNKSKNLIQNWLIENFYKKLLRLVVNLQIETILDAGCGEGFTLYRFYKNKIGKQLLGIDFSSDAINLGKKLFPFINFRKANAYSLPYKNNSFDLVVCCEVLEHLVYPEKALTEIIRVSRKFCLFSVPNEPFFALANFLRGKNLSRWGNDIEHIQHWTNHQFIALLKQKGLTIKSARSSFPWTIVLVEK
ncbi:class I SAM-dependent methyltransferase [Candidatus Roizmanbacteria bacterium CG_4_9_14_3_um_filter_36_11]|nr:MAG: class I SAM-dependent methyltransferase [Candidatus Roizmanbacteria bacterium CG_4_9_14_3_um_filter_36_11]